MGIVITMNGLMLIFIQQEKMLLPINLLNGIPFKDETFDFVYHSHVIEHFSKESAPKFLMECYRVLKQNGVIRIAFPDLEQIVYHYTRLLKELKGGNMLYESDYDWIMLELYDQTVRNVSGGEMFKYFISETIPNEKFLLERCGIEVKNLINAGKEVYLNNTNRSNYKKKLSTINVLKYLRKSILKSIHEINKKILGEKNSALQIGKFRLGGEIHQWMYDSFSLSRLLKEIGFKNIIIRDAFTSYLDCWQKYNLDTEPDGTIYKPDSNYIEALK